MATRLDANSFNSSAEDRLPGTYLISRDGKILFQSIGFSEKMDVDRDEIKRIRKAVILALARRPENLGAIPSNAIVNGRTNGRTL
jgi:hypothetical protein